MLDDTFVTSDGAAIAFTLRTASRAGAPRLALVHSLALDRSVWDGVVERLQDDTAILTYDCRGHGRSDRRTGEFTAELFARDLAELLDHVEWPRAAVAGCSMGGCVALAFAGLYPVRVSHLGLVDTTAWYGPEAATKFAERVEAARAGGMKGLAEFQATRWFSDQFRAGHPEVLQRATEVFLANDFECYAAACALLGRVDVRSLLATLRMPVAIVVGEEDYATPVTMARALHEAIPHSTLNVLGHARHLTPLEQPAQVASELLALLRRV